jgi:hypothetical protein
MTADRFIQDDRVEASRKAQSIQKSINTAAGRRLVRCLALKSRSRQVSGPDQGASYGVELRVEPLVTIADFREQAAGQIAAALREWAALLNDAAANLER